MCQGSPYTCHTPNSIIDKQGKEARLIWDGTSKRFHCEISMNKATNMELDALITFGYAYMAFCICIWRPRIYFPHGEILLAFVDISSYFCFPRISADLVGAFGFMVGWTMVLHGQYNVLRQCCFCKLVGAISLINYCFSIGVLLLKRSRKITQVAFGFGNMRWWTRWCCWVCTGHRVFQVSRNIICGWNRKIFAT